MCYWRMNACTLSGWGYSIFDSGNFQFSINFIVFSLSNSTTLTLSFPRILSLNFKVSNRYIRQPKWIDIVDVGYYSEGYEVNSTPWSFWNWIRPKWWDENEIFFSSLFLLHEIEDLKCLCIQDGSNLRSSSSPLAHNAHTRTREYNWAHTRRMRNRKVEVYLFSFNPRIRL